MTEITNASIDAVLDAMEGESLVRQYACIAIDDDANGSSGAPAIMVIATEPDTTDDTDLVETIPACIIATRQAPTRLEAAP